MVTLQPPTPNQLAELKTCSPQTKLKVIVRDAPHGDLEGWVQNLGGFDVGEQVLSAPLGCQAYHSVAGESPLCPPEIWGQNFLALKIITANLSRQITGWFHAMRTGKFIEDSTDVNHDSPKEWKFNVSKSGWYWLVVDLLVSSQVSWHQNHFKALFGLRENNSNVNPSEIIDVHWDKKCLR